MSQSPESNRGIANRKKVDGNTMQNGTFENGEPVAKGVSPLFAACSSGLVR